MCLALDNETCICYTIARTGKVSVMLTKPVF